MTTLPSLPTDNLYKFIFLAGLTIILTNFVIHTSQSNYIDSEIETLEFDMGKEEVELKFLEADALQISKEVEISTAKTKEIKKEFKSLNPNSKIDKGILIEKLKSYKEENDLLLSKIEQEKNKSKLSDLASKSITLKLKHLNNKLQSLFELNQNSRIILLVGGLMTILGLFKWYFTLQKPLDEKIKYELIQFKKESGIK